MARKNPIAAYKRLKKLSLQALADQLRTSKGHASDLVNGKCGAGKKTAARMAELTGRPWHVFVDAPAKERAA